MAERKIEIIIKKVGKAAQEETVVHSLGKMQELVGGHIELVRLPREIDMWVNEEGLLEENPQLNCRLIAFDKVVGEIYGDVFFAGHDDEGETVGLTVYQKAWLKEHMQTIGIMVDTVYSKMYEVSGITVR